MRFVAVESSVPTFRRIGLEPGFNLVVADRTQASSAQDTRNGVGKSTLIEVLHFCLGARSTKGSGLRASHLEGQSFRLTAETRHGELQIERAVDDPGKIVLAGDSAAVAAFGASGDSTVVSASAFNEALGRELFGLEADVGKFRPSFRNMASYLIRRGQGGFLSPFRIRDRELTWQTQVNAAFIAKAGWRLAGEWQTLRETAKRLDQLKKAAEQGDLDSVSGDLAALEADEIRLDQETSELAASVEAFRVEPDYELLQADADESSAEINHLLTDNIRDRRLVSLYSVSVEGEHPPSLDRLEEVYASAVVELGGAVRRSLEQVLDFHSDLVANRRDYLAAEIDRLQEAIEERQGRIDELDEARAAVIQRLAGVGAMGELMQLQRRLGEMEGRLAQLRARIGDARKFRSGSSDLRVEREKLFQRTDLDLREREESRRELIARFGRITRELYGEAGRLEIGVREQSGYDFAVDIDRKGSQGVDRMAIFAFDIAVAELWSLNDPSPGFLVHDSTIFDGVDERQRALGLKVAFESSRDHGYQYLALLNSDEIPRSDLPDWFDVEQLTRLTLTDASDEGCLLGFRY